MGVLILIARLSTCMVVVIALVSASIKYCIILDNKGVFCPGLEAEIYIKLLRKIMAGKISGYPILSE